MPAPKIYNPNQIKLIAFGVAISKGAGASGYADGDFVGFEQDGPSYIVYKGPDGSLTRVATNEPGTKITVHLAQTSGSNAIFSAMWNKGLTSLNGEDIGTFVCSDMNGTSVFESEAFWVTGPPKKGYGKNLGEILWECYGCDVERLDGGN